MIDRGAPVTQRRLQTSASELREVVEDCRRRAFAAWRLLGGCFLVREAGPVLQEIGFERLSCGEYRPISAVRVLVVPKGRCCIDITTSGIERSSLNKTNGELTM